MLILLVFFIANMLIILGIIFVVRSNFDDRVMSISKIAEHINVDNQWNVSADDEVTKLLSESDTWAMVLNNNGTVIWENSMPQQLPRQYTAPDIAKFSQLYLEEYPMLIHTLSMGLLVIGCPPNSIKKINFVISPNGISAIIYCGIFVIITNILLVLLLFWYNTHKVEKAIVPILHGIDTIAHGNIVSLSEKGEFAEINTKLNRAGQLLIKKDKARADWINGVSHDIRTPLSIILGYAGEIEDSQSLPQTTREKAGIIQKQGEKLRRLIIDLNLTSRLEYSMQPLNIEVIYLVELARQVISEFLNNGLADKYQIDFDVFPNSSDVVMQGDSSLISRMLDNLIQNSISHNPDGCHIIITVRKFAKVFKYTIIDNGIGLSKKQLEQFNAGSFSRLNYKANGETDHGFGLHLVQQIVKAHKGSITYENVSPSGLSINISFLI